MAAGLKTPTNDRVEDDLSRLALARMYPEGTDDPGRAGVIGRARTSIEEFTLACRPRYKMNWHHRIIFQYIQAWIDGRINRLMLFSPPQHGKALHVDTPIPTPHGFTRIGDLRPGQTVFGSDGRLRKVIAVSPVWKNRDVWEVEDDTGESVVADADHVWRVRLDRKGRAWTLRTTSHLAARTSQRNPMIEVQGAIEAPTADLPIDPYVLGVWLGDGASAGAIISQHDDDAPHIRRRIEAAGFKTSDQATPQTFGILGFHVLLRDAGLLKAKRVPPHYLRAAAWQRLALLQGLIDTDGHVAPDGQVEFCSIDRGLALAVQELVFSLGRKASLHEGRATWDGRDCGPKWRVMFYMAGAASLPRKLDRCRDAAVKPNRYVRFRPAGKADTVCIQTDAPDGMFLAGKNFIPTHNSEIVSRILPSYILGKHPDQHVMACSYGQGLAQDMNRDVQALMDTPAYREVFPGSVLPAAGRQQNSGKRYYRNSKRFNLLNREGGYRCGGVRTGITGHPWHWGIIDDPYRDDQDANSPAVRAATWNWYTTTFLARKTEGYGRVLITLTRWHQMDLAGQLLELAKQDKSADQWTVVLFPAILESESQRGPDDRRAVGEALWEARHPRRSLEAMRATMMPVKWSAVYQQRPTPASGVVFKTEDFRYFASERVGGRLMLLLYDTPNDAGCVPRRIAAEDCVWFQTADAGDTTGPSSSNTCVVTFARTPEGDLLVWHVWRAKLDFPRRYKAVIALRSGLGDWDEANGRFAEGTSKPWPKALAYQAMEAKASGLSMIQQGASEGLVFKALKPGQSSKTERCASAAVLYQNHKLFHHHGAEWVTDFEAEVTTFPSAEHDDQVDCLAYGGIVVTTDAIVAAAVRGGGDVVTGYEAPRDGSGNTTLRGTSLDGLYDRLMGIERAAEESGETPHYPGDPEWDDGDGDG